MKETLSKASEYYDQVGEGYQAWSPAMNIHFGYYRRGLNPFDLEAMLAQMNEEVLQRLHIPVDKNTVIVDAGCGVGESLRQMAGRLPRARFYGITISHWQVDFAVRANQEKGFEQQIEIVEADFQDMPFPDSFADAVFAIESSVYAAGHDKARLLREFERILKPGGRLVVVDGFRRDSRRFPLFFEKINRQALSAWAISELANVGLFEKALRLVGFENIIVENIGWRVLPSAMHVPFTMIKLIWKNIRGKGSPGSRRYLKALLLSAVMGFWHGRFGYYMISGEKPAT